MFKLKSIENNLEKTNINIDDQGRIGIKDIEPTAQLDINGTLRVRSLENQELLKDKKPTDLSPLVSDQDGNIFSLPYGGYDDMQKDHFNTPMFRSGGKHLNPITGNLALEIKNLFGSWNFDFKDGRHLVEIKLLLRSNDNTAVNIDYISEKLKILSVSGDKDEHDFKIEDEIKLKSDVYRFSMEIVKNGNDRDVLMKYSGNDWLNVRYFITVYPTF